MIDKEKYERDEDAELIVADLSGGISQFGSVWNEDCRGGGSG